MLYHILGALAWNGDVLSSGSRDRLILQRDARTPNAVERRLIGHRQEVGPPPPPPKKASLPSPFPPPKNKKQKKNRQTFVIFHLISAATLCL